MFTVRGTDLLDDVEDTFDYGRVTLPASRGSRIRELRQRVLRMQGSALPGLAGGLQLKTGGAYAVDSPSLAMALMAGPSRAGEWSAVIGIDDFGLEAAAAYGLDLDRTVIIPEPGEHWLSVTAGLLEVATLVAVRPPEEVSEQQAERLRSRLRQKDAALVCLGNWPRSDATLLITGSTWFGLGRGHGHLTRRQVEVAITSAGPPRRVTLWLPGLDLEVTEVERAPLVAVRAG